MALRSNARAVASHLDAAAERGTKKIDRSENRLKVSSKDTPLDRIIVQAGLNQSLSIISYSVNRLLTGLSANNQILSDYAFDFWESVLRCNNEHSVNLFCLYAALVMNAGKTSMPNNSLLFLKTLSTGIRLGPDDDIFNVSFELFKEHVVFFTLDPHVKVDCQFNNPEALSFNALVIRRPENDFEFVKYTVSLVSDETIDSDMELVSCTTSYS